MNTLNKMVVGIGMVLVALSADAVAWWPFTGWAAEDNKAFIEEGGYRLALENREGQIWISIEDLESASETFSENQTNLSLFVDGRSVLKLENEAGLLKGMNSRAYPNRLERSVWRADWGFDFGPVRSIMRAKDQIIVWYTNSRNKKNKVEFGVRSSREAIAEAFRASLGDRELKIRKFEKNRAEMNQINTLAARTIAICPDERCGIRILKCQAQQLQEWPKGEVRLNDFNHCIK